MAKISDAARSAIAVMRARASIGAKKKGGKKGGGRRRSGAGRGGFLKTVQLGTGGGLFEMGGTAILGGVALSRFFKLPVWLSPIGAALYLYGWYKGNAMIKTLAIFIIGLGLAETLGLPTFVGQKVDEIRAKGIFGALGTGTQASSGTGGGTKQSSLDEAIDTVASAGDAYGKVKTAFA